MLEDIILIEALSLILCTPGDFQGKRAGAGADTGFR